MCASAYETLVDSGVVVIVVFVVDEEKSFAIAVATMVGEFGVAVGVVEAVAAAAGFGGFGFAARRLGLIVVLVVVRVVQEFVVAVKADAA